MWEGGGEFIDWSVEEAAGGREIDAEEMAEM